MALGKSGHFSRRTLLALLPAALAWPGGVGRGDTDSKLDLQETLEKGLKARRRQEFQFIGRVVNLVESGELPEKMVQSTFLWARRKREHPMQYFERALRVQAAKIGVRI
jgi:hypothetical protein